jgi:pSer/pThr/pTyr-binding forkhead associated (FHA) protein
VQADFEDTVTRAPVLEPSPGSAYPDSAEPDGADTIVKPPQLEEPAAPTRPVHDPYASHGAWPATDGGLPGRSSAAPPVVPETLVFGFRVGSSRIVTLDSIVYLGRRPSAPRIVRGGIPQLVRVQSPTNEVSSTHVELRQSGRTVVVTDMRSTNGTRVMLPGFPARRLRQGEAVVVTAGTLIDIGDRNVIEIVRVLESPADNSPAQEHA